MTLSAQERVHLVRLATDRPEQYLCDTDSAIAKRVLNKLVNKGMATWEAPKWRPTEQGLLLANQIF
jgi:threonine synthase